MRAIKLKLVVPRRKEHLEAARAANLMATAGAVELVNRAREARPDNGPRCLIVPSRIDRRTSAGREIEGALEQFGEKVGPALGQRTVFVDAFAAGQWVGEYSPRSKAAAEVSALSKAILRMLKWRNVKLSTR